jgi:hypothetical protein
MKRDNNFECFDQSAILNSLNSTSKLAPVLGVLSNDAFNLFSTGRLDFLAGGRPCLFGRLS